MAHVKNLSIKDIKLYVLRIFPQAFVATADALGISFYLGFVEMSFHSHSPKSLSAQSQGRSQAWNIST